MLEPTLVLALAEFEPVLGLDAADPAAVEVLAAEAAVRKSPQEVAAEEPQPEEAGEQKWSASQAEEQGYHQGVHQGEQPQAAGRLGHQGRRQAGASSQGVEQRKTGRFSGELRQVYIEEVHLKPAESQH